MHGVGASVLAEVFAKAGFAPVLPVAEQIEPDPAFPTVSFPNPEEPGAMDLVFAVAQANDADLAIANDPDADRCAVAIPTRGPGGDGWRMLRGDEVGVLLADHLMRRGVNGLYATTIVSSSMLSALARARGMDYAETLTGFKWIVRAGGVDADKLVFGYEEAIGYCVAPRTCGTRTASPPPCWSRSWPPASRRAAHARRPAGRAGREFGLYATDQLSARFEDLSQIGEAMARVRAHPPQSLLDEAVTSVEDLAPDADVVILRTPPPGWWSGRPAPSRS
jgi:phosphomannomutase